LTFAHVKNNSVFADSKKTGKDKFDIDEDFFDSKVS
jgi:hypothetical protein